MATPHEKMVSVCKNLQVEENDYVEDYEEIGTSSCCGCFQGLRFRWFPNDNGGGTYRYLIPGAEPHSGLGGSWPVAEPEI